jgi:hypothetical protein
VICTYGSIILALIEQQSLPMSDVILPSPEVIGSGAHSFQHDAKPRGFFVAIFEALQHSRRLEAQHILRRYRHLIASKSRDHILKGIHNVLE